MDEVSFLYDFKDIVPLGAEHSSLGAVADDVARHMSGCSSLYRCSFSAKRCSIHG